MAKLIFGCGYLGSRVADLWCKRGETVVAATRNSAKAEMLKQRGITPLIGDITEPSTLERLPEADTVLFAVGFDRSSSHTIEKVYADGLRNVLGALPSAPHRIIYISTTGVYGHAAGDWIDEFTPCHPEREGGRASLAAEQVLAQHAYCDRGVILRLAGIYGPGRIPRRADLLAGRSIDAPALGYLNLIHVDDAAHIVDTAAKWALPPRTYNVSDGHPVERAEYYRELARLLGAPPPTFSEPPSDSPAARRAQASKRVSNALLVSELEITFAHPSYREGLAAIVAAENME